MSGSKDSFIGYACEDIIKSVWNKFKNMGYQEFDERKGLTVEALCYFCMEEIAKGNGQRHVQISMDDEGNGFHSLFYGFSTEEMDAFDHHDDVDYNEIIHPG